MADLDENNIDNTLSGADIPGHPDSDEHLIADYLNGHLAEAELKAFEQRLLNESKLQEEVQFQKELAATVRQRERRELKRRLDELKSKETKFDDRAAAKYATVRSYRGEPVENFDKRKPALAVAAVIVTIVAASAVFYFLKKESPSSPEQFAQVGNLNDSTKSGDSINTDTITNLNTGSDKVTQFEKKQNQNIASLPSTNLDIKSFSFTQSGFGFGQKAKSKLMTLFYDSLQIDNQRAKESYYKLTKSELSLYTGIQKDVSVYFLSKTESEDAELEILPGHYVYLKGYLYPLIDDGEQHRLQPVSAELNQYLLKQL